MTDAPRPSSKTPLVLSGLALAVAVAGTGGPAIARAIAPNSDKVDGFHAVGAKASPTKRAGKLVATGANGRLPQNILEPSLPDVLPSGTTMRGAWGIDVKPTPGETGSWGTTISFPVPLPEGMKLQVLGEAGWSEECQGPNYAPTAAPGWVCVYTSIEDLSGPVDGRMSTVYGVDLWAHDDGTTGHIFHSGTWAATAP